MAQVLATRATSLAASTLLLGAAGLAALTASTVIENLALPDRTPVQSILRDIEPPPAPTPRPRVERPDDPAFEVPLPPHYQSPMLTEATPSSAVFDLGQANGPVLIEHARWVRRPAGLDRYYPRRAREAGMEGVVELDCLVSAEGALRCAVEAESPANWGFAAAALRMAGDHQMVPAARDGAAVEGRHHMRIPFQLD